jgi:predicted dehydrogenase
VQGNRARSHSGDGSERRQLVQIGAGLWGGTWLNVVEASSDWALAAVVDIDDASLAAAAASHGLPESRCFTSIEDAVAARPADAALVVVPPEYHAPVALDALEAGLDCLIEKPFTTTIPEARAVESRASALGRTVMVSQNYRFKRAAQTVRGAIHQGSIGEIGQVFGRFMKAPPFTGFRTQMEEPLLVDMAIHHFDFIRGIFGLEPARVWARSFNPPWTIFEGNASAAAVFTTESGAVVTYNGTWVNRGAPTTWDGSWTVHGTRGGLEWADNRIMLWPETVFDTVFQPGMLERGDTMDVPPVHLEFEDRAGSLHEFARALDERREPDTSARDNLRSLALVLGAVESARTGREIDLDAFRGEA